MGQNPGRIAGFAVVAPLHAAASRPKSLERAAANLWSLAEAGHDPMRLIVDRARDKGLDVFLSFRLNEVHAVEQEDSLLFSTFWKDHPEWRIGKAGDPLPEEGAILPDRERLEAAIDAAEERAAIQDEDT